MISIVKYPDPVLRQIAEPVDPEDPSLDALISDMADAMYMDEGVGLAAPQIGISKRVIVLDVGENLMALVNPEIIRASEERDAVEEGCLSLPDIRVDVSRPVIVDVRGIDSQGSSQEIRANGLLARALQHEIDHLNGILIIDHATAIQRTFLKSKLKKLEKQV